MTIAVTTQAMDGMVFAADSASTLATQAGVGNIYNHANKVANLCKGKPVAAMFWGSGSIGPASMITLAKDLRRLLCGEEPSPNGVEWELGDDWSVHQVAQRVAMFLGERATAALGDGQRVEAGIAVGGYSPGKHLSERYEITIFGDSVEGPEDPYDGDTSNIVWRGEAEPLTRLVLGFSRELPTVLVDDFGAPKDEIGSIIESVRAKTEAPLVHPAMPVQDMIDLSEFLVDVAKQWVRFVPKAPTVGGPTEVAAITKHEGFKWVRRKHYFPSELNTQVAH